MTKYWLIIIWISLFYSCSSSKIVTSHPREDKISNLIDSSLILVSGFSGMVLYDLDDKKSLFQRNKDKYFVAASNTKLFTTYACLKLLGDSIPAFRYQETDSTFTIWGTSDPTLFHPFFESSKILDFLISKVAEKQIIYSDDHVALPYYGQGWMWDDYNDYYQVELSPLPLYGNVLRFTKEDEEIRWTPNIFQDSIILKNEGRRITRELRNNLFNFPKSILTVPKFFQDIPYTNTKEINLKLLENILGKPIIINKLPLTEDVKTYYSFPLDTVCRRMMQISDNMLAEHLLLAAGMAISDTISSKVAINKIKEIYLADTPQPLNWVDGSGLSRYNMLTPSSILYLLLKMVYEFPERKIFSLMALGGGNGTLSNVYNAQKSTYMFAKSGSMGGVYNLSGYMISKSGKKLAFSFMNNNFNSKISEVRMEVERILDYIRSLY